MQRRRGQALALRPSGADSIRRLPGIRVEAPALLPHPASRAAVDWLRELVGGLGALPAAAVDDAERIDQIAALESVKAAATAAQASLISDFHHSQVSLQRLQGMSARRLGGGIAEQVALARRVSPTTGQRQVAFARALIDEMPQTLEQMRRGEVSEWVATLVVRETSALSREDRSQVDAELAPELPTMSPREAETAARRRSYAIDAESALRRSRTSRGDRRVSIRPPDTMALVTGFVPVEQGVAAYASLDREATAAKAAGDRRSRGQIMSDTFIERLTGQATAGAVSAEIAITMTAQALLAGGDTPAQIPGYGPIPAELARQIASGNAVAEASQTRLVGREGSWWPSPSDSSGANESAADTRRTSERCSECRRRDRADETRARVFVRRIFTDPVNSTVMAVDTRKRLFPPSLGRLFQFRDQVCRVSYCTAPIRHDDHVMPHRVGGLTSADNGQGLCERSNQVKELPGWQVVVLPGDHHRTLITTPTGHAYESHAPPALGPGAG